MSNTAHTFHSTAIAAVNEALVVLGQDIVLQSGEMSLSSSVANGRKAAFVYESARLKVLRDHPWNFARRTVGCLGYAVDDGTGDSFRAKLPAKCVRLLMCYGIGDRQIRYSICGDEIRAKEPIKKVSYVGDVEDLNKWSPDAYRALVIRIAADLAKPITGRINERQLQESAYNEIIADAKLQDARENNTPEDAWGENHYAVEMNRSRRTADYPFRR